MILLVREIKAQSYKNRAFKGWSFLICICLLPVLFHEDEVEVNKRAVSERNAGFSTLEAQLRRAGQAEDGAGNVRGNVAWEEAATHLGKVQKQARKLCGLRSVPVESRDEAGNVHDGAQANEPA